MWKLFVVVFSVLCVLLLWISHLLNSNKALEIQNCTLQQTLEITSKAAREKQERNRNELERLQKELDSLRELDNDWSNTPLPDDVHNRMYEICNGHRGTCSAS